MNQRLAQSILIVCVAAGLIQPPLLAQTPVSGQASQQSGKSPVKVFILAGQSNMEGQAVADLGGKDYNEGKGTLQVLLTGPWVQAPGEWDILRKAQAAAAARPEFEGNVVFVATHDFVRQPEDSPNPGHGHHESGNAETYFLVGEALGEAMADFFPFNRAELMTAEPEIYELMQAIWGAGSSR